MKIFQPTVSGSLVVTGSASVTGSLNVSAGITGSLLGSASYATTASYALNGGSGAGFPYSGSAVISGSLLVTGSGVTISGSLNVSGSTIQTGTNTLLGNTTLSGSIIISGALGQPNPTISIFGDLNQTGYTRYLPVTSNIDTSLSASYIFVSGSTNDLYFSQNGQGYSNVTRLRWIEGNMYTGLLNGGLITTQSSTVYQVSSGSGIIVNLNASYNSNPYPTIEYLNWPNLSASIAPLSASYDQQFVAIQSNGTIFAQGEPYTDGQYNTLISIGVVVHQNRSTINAVQTFPSVAYGWKQRSNDFINAFGPIKISGYVASPSGSSTGSLVLSGGTAYVNGRNYTVDPNNPSYITEAVGIATSKIYRYYQSGSAAWVYDTNGGVGYPVIDPSKYSNNGVLTALSNNNYWSIQRIFYFPNSATKAFYIYYGNAEYAQKADAVAAITTEPFNEAPNTAANAVFVGYMLLRANANFTVAASYEFRAAGLFRGSGTAVGGGSATVTTLASLADVSITSPVNHQLLAYNGSTLKWENVSSITANVTGNLTGTASTASYVTGSIFTNDNIAASASYAVTASYILNAVSASFAQTASYVLQAVSSSFAQTASYVLQAVSASYATTASYITTAQTASYVTTAQTASFVTGSNVVGDIAGNANNITAYTINQNLGTTNEVTFAGVTGSLFGTASWATDAITASFLPVATYNITSSWAVSASQAVSSSHAITASAVTGTVTNAINAQSGSNFVVTSTLAIDETLTDFAKVNSTIVGANNLLQQATGSWTSAHCRYTVYKGANSRAGEFVVSWNGTTTSYYDNATVDIGNTSDITFQAAIVSSQLQVNAVAASSAWTVKMIATYL